MYQWRNCIGHVKTPDAQTERDVAKDVSYTSTLGLLDLIVFDSS